MRNQYGERNCMWRDIISEEELRELYINQKQSIKFISVLKGCAENPIRRRLKMWNIPIRNYEEQFRITLKEGRIKRQPRNINSMKGNRKTYLEIAKKHLNWVCGICGKKFTNETFDLVVHHKNRNNKDNKLSNLQVLCQSCHLKKHKAGGCRK